MKRMTRSWLALALLFCLVFPAVSMSEGGEKFSFNSYPVDVDALKALEEQDAFEARVTKKTVTDRVNASSGTLNRDILSMTVQNDSSVTISGVVILAVAYNEEKYSAELQSSMLNGLGIDGTAKRTISTLVFDSLAIAPGTAGILTAPCAHYNFTGVRVLVAQYTDAEGRSYTNDLYPEWQELALGSPTIILD